MNTPTPTPTCGELSCDECNNRTAALTAERDQLRAEVNALVITKDKACAAAVENKAEADGLRAALALGQQNCDDAYEDLRDERDAARAELATCKDTSKSLLESLRAEVERLRSDRDCEKRLRKDADEFRENAIERAERAEAEVSKLTDALDMMRDEFMRIIACPGCDAEIEDLANRAQLKLIQRVPVITQLDRAEAQLTAERARLDWLESDAGVDWQWSDAARTVSRASIDVFMKEDAK
jgi:multidrug efflux pump subunit AcrA (membrane-fusion protein)